MKYEIIDGMVFSFFSSQCDMSNQESDLAYKKHMSVRRFGEPMFRELMIAWNDDEFSWKKIFETHEVILDQYSEEEARDLAKILLIDPILVAKLEWDN